MKNNRNFQNMEIGRSLWTFTKKIPLVMKLFIFYLFCSIGMLQAVESYAQNARLSLNVEEETVANILQQIENASDFDFFYNNSHVDLNRRVSVSAQNSDIFAILKEIFEGTEVRYTVLDKKIILSTELTAQGTQQQGNVVKGKVVDTNGEPVIGATIKEVGTDNGTVTDIDGNFTINTQANANLEISFIGYQSQTVKAVTGKELAITLKEDTGKKAALLLQLQQLILRNWEQGRLLIWDNHYRACCQDLIYRWMPMQAAISILHYPSMYVVPVRLVKIVMTAHWYLSMVWKEI